MCNYGEHPLDKYDTQAHDPEISRTCDYCLDDIQVGVMAYLSREDAEHDKALCSTSCLVRYCSEKYVESAEFEWKVCGE